MKIFAPIIFLDIDGVLNCFSDEARYKQFRFRDHRNWNDFSIAALNDIQRQTSSVVVISSTWRLLPQSTISWWNEQFRLCGLCQAVIGMTRSSKSGWRGQEVANFLQDNAYRQSRHPHIILDDDDDFHKDQPSIHIDGQFGLRPEHVEQAVKLLNSQK